MHLSPQSDHNTRLRLSLFVRSFPRKESHALFQPNLPAAPPSYLLHLALVWERPHPKSALKGSSPTCGLRSRSTPTARAECSDAFDWDISPLSDTNWSFKMHNAAV